MRFLNSLNSFGKSLRRSWRWQRTEKRVSRPTVEALEDRLVLSTAHQFGPILNVVASPGESILFQQDVKDHSKLDLFTDNGTIGVLTPLGQFQAASIKTVNVFSQGSFGEAVQVDYSNGVPFAPGTNVSLSGNGVNHFLDLFDLTGSKGITGNETYTAGTATQAGSLTQAGTTFRFSSAFSTVADKVPNTSPADTLDVNAPGRTVTLSGAGGFQEQFDGLANGGGGNTLIFANKAEVVLELENDIALATLKATGADPTLKGLTIDVFGAFARADIKATPSSVSTVVQAIGKSDSVDVRANAGFVNVLGNSTTQVTLGSDPFNSATSVTSGINRDVSVIGVGKLFIEDGGNAKTSEKVKVTESTVSGSGLFGNNSVVVRYSSTSLLQLDPGQLANTYTVAASHLGARFLSSILINAVSSNKVQNVVVDLDSRSGLNLTLFDLSPATAHLHVSAPGGTFNPLKPTTPNGKETVTFTGGLTSTVTYFGFDNVSLT
jgi:hypothetical protein